MSKYQKAAVFGLFALGIFFAFFYLSESPPLNYDEGWYIQTSTNLASTGVDGIQLAPGQIEHISKFLTVGYPLIYPLGAWFKIFGAGILEARIFAVLFLLGSLCAVYFLVRKLFGNPTAIAVLLLVATFPPLYGNGKSVLGEVPGMLYLLLSLLFFSLIRTHAHRRALWIALSGLAAGLCIATKPAFIVLIPALAIGAFVEWRRRALSPKEISIACVSAIIPVLVWLVVQFGGGDSLTDILAFYSNPSGVGDAVRTILNNLHRLFSDVGTLYTVFLMAIWSWGLVLRARSGDKVSFEEIVAFSFSVLVVLSFMRTVGFYRYLFPAQLLALVFFPYSLQYVLRAVARCFSFLGQSWTYVVVIALLGALGVYQLSFDSYVAESYGSRSLADMHEYFSAIPSDRTVYFYNAPSAVPMFRGHNYYQYLILFDQWYIGEDTLPVLASGKPDIIVVGVGPADKALTHAVSGYDVDAKFGKLTVLERR